MITIFSAPKPFSDTHIATIQGNAVESWSRLGDDVQVILMGDEAGIEQQARKRAMDWIGELERSSSGAPLVNDVFTKAAQAARHPILCYVNADVILLPDLLTGVRAVAERLSAYLIVGQRWDLPLTSRLGFELGWEMHLIGLVADVGSRHPPMGSDYFVFPAGLFSQLPGFALGRAGWDNWMIYSARHDGIPVIDASRAITAVHQEHDYAHLKDGRPHYQHAESRTNVDAGGGMETIFRLRDADWLLGDDGPKRKSLTEWEWPRKIEADWIARLGAGRGAWLVRLLFHPLDFIRYYARRRTAAAVGEHDLEVDRT